MMKPQLLRPICSKVVRPGWTFIPRNAQPFQRTENILQILGAYPLGIQIIDSQENARTI
jgi:hypothetical protein